MQLFFFLVRYLYHTIIIWHIICICELEYFIKDMAVLVAIPDEKMTKEKNVNCQRCISSSASSFIS